MTELESLGAKLARTRGAGDARSFAFVVEGESARAIVLRAIAGGANVSHLAEQRETLEDLFLRDALKSAENV